MSLYRPLVGYRCSFNNIKQSDDGVYRSFRINFQLGNGDPNIPDGGYLFNMFLDRNKPPVFVPTQSQDIHDVKSGWNKTDTQLAEKTYRGSIAISLIGDVVFTFDLYIDGTSIIGISFVTIQLQEEWKSVSPRSNLTLQLERKCPRLRILSSSDMLTGANLGMVLFRTETNTYTKYPPLTSVVKGEECTLYGKLYGNPSAIVDNVVKYGMLRYFLWFLIKGKWSIRILTRRYTKHFFNELSKSDYACWAKEFDTPELKGYDVYFIY